MDSPVHEIAVRSTQREELLDVTAQIRATVRQAGIRQGVVWIYCPHTTAAVIIQENTDPDLRADILRHLSKLVPQEGFRHSEGNADAHIKSALLGPSQGVLLDKGQLVLGTWQAIYFCELDGPRQRQLLVKILAG
jgi:secondary thiamine-phosphate synthase enzyme